MIDYCCHKCGKKYLLDVRYINGKPTCKKCYYEELGKIIEKHPIGRPIDET